jgi:uncharacterized membrane protein YjjP (DUF1212 family)
MNVYKKYRNRLEKYLQTERGKRFINFAYSIGAAILILGAMFKLLHFPFGNELIFIGMATEVIMFTLSAFDTPIRDYNWDKVFPVLSNDNLEEHEKVNSNLFSGQPNTASFKSTNQSVKVPAEFSETNLNLSPQAEEYAKQMENLKNETEKMAKQLKELNEVYSRMLQAMSNSRDK